MKFEWDPAKAAENYRKHGVTFTEAVSVFEDPLAVTQPDPDCSEGEERLLTFGMSHAKRLLVVSHTDKGDTPRIISARALSRHERRVYEEG